MTMSDDDTNDPMGEGDHGPFINFMRKVDFSKPTEKDIEQLGSMIATQDNEELLITLAEQTSNFSYGLDFFKWLFKTKGDPYRLLHVSSEMGSAKTPTHHAVASKNHHFLNCLLQLGEENQEKFGVELVAALRNRDPMSGNKTCLQAAILESLPCVARMVKLCELVHAHHEQSLLSAMWNRRINKEESVKLESILLMKTVDGSTVMHYLIKDPTKISKSWAIRTNTTLPGREMSNTTSEYKSLDVILAMEESQVSMEEVWSSVDNSGQSPYKLLDDKTGTLETRETSNKKQVVQAKEFRRNIRERIINSTSKIPILKRALYGTKGKEKELCLDLSDFNYSSHNFESFVNEFTKPNTGDLFEQSLMYVVLPDLNNFKKPAPHQGVGKLLKWLSEETNGNVKRIKSLIIPDSTTSPMSDELVAQAILKRFEIERFDWRKLDMNLDVLTESPSKEEFTDLTLYSTGNYSVLYHWTSDDGLAQLKGLRNLKIKIMELNAQSQPEEARNNHKARMVKYKTKVETRLDSLNERRPPESKIEFDVSIGNKWNFPETYYKNQRPNEIEELDLVKKLKYWQTILPEIASDRKSKWYERFRELIKLQQKEGVDNEHLVKVAIIDNGADKFRTGVRESIIRGISYVKADLESTDRILPWWMVSDPHGTQMASLITAINPWCGLYIARVGKHRRDILPDDAAEAVQWAIDQQVDIISISWITKTRNVELEKAVEAASKKALVFCSTADEGGWSGPVYPAYYKGTVRVSATDRYGNLRLASDPGNGTAEVDAAHINLAGEEIPASGPSYMGDSVQGTVSGSSVATALGAGCASLAIFLLRLFNPNLTRNALLSHNMYQNKYMAKLLNEGIKNADGLSLLYPPKDEQELDKLSTQWALETIEERVKPGKSS